MAVAVVQPGGLDFLRVSLFTLNGHVLTIIDALIAIVIVGTMAAFRGGVALTGATLSQSARDRPNAGTPSPARPRGFLDTGMVAAGTIVEPMSRRAAGRRGRAAMHRPFRVSRRRLLAMLLAAPTVIALAQRVRPSDGTAHALTLPGYRIDADVDIDAGTVAASQVVTFRSTAGVPLDSVVFRAVAASVGTFALEAATVDGAAAEGRLDGSVLEVPLAVPLQPGSTIELGLRY